MTKLEAEDAHYSPVYFMKSGFYDKTILVYGAMGTRIYRGYTGKEAIAKYKEEWADLEMANAY